MIYKINVLYHDLSFPLHKIHQGLFDFDGTPYSAAREWAALYGFTIREFTSTTPGNMFEIVHDQRASVRIEEVHPTQLFETIPLTEEEICVWLAPIKPDISIKPILDSLVLQGYLHWAPGEGYRRLR